jgi:hypothetical protein
VTTDTLLPPNATPQERAIEAALRPGADVVAGVDLIRTAKENPPDDWLYWLVWEYGLEELIPYLSDPRDILEDGIQWQRIRGTPASLSLALSWLGVLAAYVEEEDPLTRHWYEYQIDPGLIPERPLLENIVGLARLSAPVGTRLSRVYHGYDLRRAIYDRTSWSDGSLYSDHSGVWDDPLQVDLSFGRVTQFWGAALLDGSVSAMAETRLHSVYAENASAAAYAMSQPVTGIIGQGVGRNLLVADSGTISDGEYQATGGARAEKPQFPITQFSATSADIDGWGEAVGWGDRTWGQSAL